MTPSRYQLFADGVLVLHFAIVVFVVAGLPLIVAGGSRRAGAADRGEPGCGGARVIVAPP